MSRANGRRASKRRWAIEANASASVCGRGRVAHDTALVSGVADPGNRADRCVASRWGSEPAALQEAPVSCWLSTAMRHAVCYQALHLGNIINHDFILRVCLRQIIPSGDSRKFAWSTKSPTAGRSGPAETGYGPSLLRIPHHGQLAVTPSSAVRCFPRVSGPRARARMKLTRPPRVPIAIGTAKPRCQLMAKKAMIGAVSPPKMAPW